MADFNPSLLNAQDQMISVDDSGLDPNALTQSAAPWMSSVQLPPLASSATKGAIMRQGQAMSPTNAGAMPWMNQAPVDPTALVQSGSDPFSQGVVMPDEDMSTPPPARTDFTQDIDGAFSQRSAGAKHFSEIARSGNGNATSDLDVQDDKDYTEVDGLGEHLECLSLVESTRVDGLGRLANIPQFRWPHMGEVPPYAPAPGKTWVRRRVVTNARQPGGTRVAKVKWAMMSPAKVQQAIASGNLPGSVSGLGAFTATTGISLGVGIAAGLALYLLVLRKKK
jgi:hypothetical protein